MNKYRLVAINCLNSVQKFIFIISIIINGKKARTFRNRAHLQCDVVVQEMFTQRKGNL